MRNLSVVKIQIIPNLNYRFNSPNQNLGKCQIDSKIYMEKQKTQNSQQNIEGEEQNWRTDTTWLQDLS